MIINLSNKHFLVTGGSRGIGKSIVSQLLKSGASVSFTYHRGIEKANSVFKEFESLYPGKVAYYQSDIKDEEQSRNLISEIEKSKLGSLDGLINNAGITADSPFFSMTTDMWNDVMNTNLTGTFFLTKSVIKSFYKEEKFKNNKPFFGFRSSRCLRPSELWFL